jgi:hypothetical protein
VGKVKVREGRERMGLCRRCSSETVRRLAWLSAGCVCLLEERHGLEACMAGLGGAFSMLLLLCELACSFSTRGGFRSIDLKRAPRVSY